jgi:hypothetical protein
VDVTQFKVQTPALAAAAPVIKSAASHAGSAQRAATAAAGQEGAFGGEPIGAVFAEMCGRAQGATSELEQTGQTLARNVAMAAFGYLNTDRGIVAMYRLPGFKP